MGTFRTEICIDAPPGDVWAVLADIGAISRWNPGVVESHLSSAASEGKGAARHCDLGGQNYLDTGSTCAALIVRVWTRFCEG